MLIALTCSTETLDRFVCLYLLLLSWNILPEVRPAIESGPATAGANRRVAFSSKVILPIHKHMLFYCKIYSFYQHIYFTTLIQHLMLTSPDNYIYLLKHAQKYLNMPCFSTNRNAIMFKCLIPNWGTRHYFM
jgi:hypothetical protein